MKKIKFLKKQERRMLVFDGLRLCFFLFQRGRKGLRRGLNYKCIMLLLRFLTVELHKKKS